MSIHRVSIYLATFVITLLLSLALTFVHAVYKNPQAFFVMAAADGNITRMRVLEVFDVDVNAPACKYRNCPLPLVYAAWQGQKEAVIFLIERGADVNEGGNFDKTPLMMASYFGETEIVKLLIANGADVNLTNGDGDTALCLAQQRRQSAVIRLLRQAGAISTSRSCE